MKRHDLGILSGLKLRSALRSSWVMLMVLALMLDSRLEWLFDLASGWKFGLGLPSGSA